MLLLKGSLRLASISGKLQAGIALQGIFVLSLCYSYIYSLNTYSQQHRRHEVKRDIPFELPDSDHGANPIEGPTLPRFQPSLVTGSTVNSKLPETVIAFFGIVPYWKEILSNQEHRNKRWIRNVLEGTRVRCHGDETSSVRVSYTETPEDIIKADIVIFANIFNWMSDDVWDRLIELRPPGQKWVMSTQESPQYVPGLKPPFRYRNISYDWSDTYRSDASFPSPYGKYVSLQSKDQAYTRQHKLEALIKGKDKSVAWVASHCETLQWNRTKFVEDLQQFIPIDTYGKCGTKTLPWRRKELLRKVMEPYRFYLSFENSCCDQYITEKFWRSLDFGMIPVVVGAPLQNYLDLAPPDSFLHVDQFNSLKEMADYMLEISRNPRKMRKHLSWRTKGDVFSEEIQDHILNPLRNTTLCAIVKRFRSNVDSEVKTSFDFFGDQWENSCHTCGTKSWMRSYQTS